VSLRSKPPETPAACVATLQTAGESRSWRHQRAHATAGSARKPASPLIIAMLHLARPDRTQCNRQCPGSVGNKRRGCSERASPTQRFILATWGDGRRRRR